MANARAWALRCQLEAQLHQRAAFTTLTYNDESLPPTLDKRHVQRWLKRLRKKMGPARPLRFFACGEYGEQTARPHYHAILYGIGQDDEHLVEETWGHGHTRTEQLTPARIAYAAGYAAKKIGYMKDALHERVDPSTGEVYTWQPPFIQMSRRPGIGGHARQWVNSWRLFAVHNGTKMPVPRFLHEAWKKQATAQQQEELLFEKSKLTTLRDTSPERLEAAEKIAISKQKKQAERRKY